MSCFFRELQRRSVFQVAGVYTAVAFIVLQGADLTFPALLLSENAYRALVLLILAGFPVAILAAWFFDVRLTRGTAPSAASAEAAPRRYQLLSVAVITILIACAGGVSAVRTRMSEPHAADGRIAVAVFPFRAVGTDAGEWTEGIADLLATALEGTERLRVVDPWALWQPLRAAAGEAAASPDPTRAADMARAVGARRIVLGSVVAHGERVDVSLRIYDPRLVRPLHTFSRNGARADMAPLVERIAIDVITRIWDEEALPGMTRLEPNVTQSQEALKAYLAAKTAWRRGLLDSAVTAIDRAITLDTTFALALMDAVAIHSWHQFSTGLPYSGLLSLLERARAHDDSLAERYRLRLEAMAASVDTRGADAAAALRRIIELDSADLAAWDMLSYVHAVYGWQYGATLDDAIAATRRVVRLDSSYAPALASQVWQELATDSARLDDYIARLLRADTSVMMTRSTLSALRALRADAETFEAMKQSIAAAPPTDWIAPVRYLRTYDPSRATALLVQLREAATAGLPAVIAAGNHARQLVTQGRTAAVDSALRAGDYSDPQVLTRIRLSVAAASLAGLGDPTAVRNAVDALTRYVPLDSARAYFDTRPAWWVVWLTGAYHAQEGDTSFARRARHALGTLPAGGSPATYREALQADIDARMAARVNDVPRALAHARRAFELWSIHTENQPESMPEPAIRFQLALLLKASSDTTQAQRLLQSLVPPATWLGFYTARAHFELGEIALARGDSAAARRNYAAALRYWRDGGPEIATWRSQAQAQFARVSRPG
ncbi:hypothetical protein BH23GEM9_BH23GEM9_03330 [soil metagenome]